MKIQFDTTLERDIDLLIMEEFVSDNDFAKIFLDAVGVKELYTIEEVIHSNFSAGKVRGDFSKRAHRHTRFSFGRAKLDVEAVSKM